MKILKTLSSSIIIIALFVIPVFVLAQAGGNNSQSQTGGNNTTIGVKIDNPLNCGSSCTLMGLVASILNDIVMPIAAVAVVMWIIYAGFTFITAQGKPAEIEKAKARLLWSLIGAGILLGAAAISNVVVNTVKSLT